MLFKTFSTIAILAATASTQDFNLVSNKTDDIYIESKNGNDTVGYSFTLYQNVLTVLMNATTAGGTIEPATYAVLPNLIIEYNSTIPAANSTSVFGFQDKANSNQDWDEGLKVVKRGSDVYEISGNWTNPGTDGPSFDAKMFVASKNTTYQNITLHADEITMLFGVSNFPFKFQNSSLAFDQIVLSQVVLHNSTGNGSLEYSNNEVATLFINETALVDGKNQSITGGSLDEENLNIVTGNSTTLNTTSLTSQDILLTFSNSNGARNVTFEQRLALNMSALDDIAATNNLNNNAAGTIQVSRWLSPILVFSSLLIALPVLLL